MAGVGSDDDLESVLSSLSSENERTYEQEQEEQEDEEGSDLSALTSERGDELSEGGGDDDGDDDQDEEDIDDVEDGRAASKMEMEMEMDPGEMDPAKGTAALPAAAAAAASTAMAQSHSHSSSIASSVVSAQSHSTSTSTSTSTKHHKRGKGRPPRKQNAILAAKKRQATKRANASAAREMDDAQGEGDGDGAGTQDAADSLLQAAAASHQMYAGAGAGGAASSTSSEGEGEGGGGDKHTHLTSHAHRDMQQQQLGRNSSSDNDDDEEDEDITSEAERLRAPLPPFPDDSADEDYLEEEHNKPQQQQQQRNLAALSSSSAARSRGRKQPRGSNTATTKQSPTSPKRSSPQSRRRILERQAELHAHALESGQDLSDTGSEAPHGGPGAAGKGAKIIVTEDSPSGVASAVTGAGALASPASQQQRLAAINTSLAHHALQAETDLDDAMSGVSEDIPILLQATAKAAAAAAAAQAADQARDSHHHHHHQPADDELDSAMATPDPGQLEYAQFASADLKEGTPELGQETAAASGSYLPIPSTSSRGRAKSPSGPGFRGRGRGGPRGRGKHRSLHKAIEYEDTDAAVSANEAGPPTNGEREGSVTLETPATSDAEDEPPDSTVAKKRAEAIEALTKIEIEFAQIRDLLFLEKMEELARERWQIEAGTHPECVQLMQMIEHRRKAKLDLASKILAESEVSSVRGSNAGHRAAWYDWIDERLDLRRSLADEANTKRRRLDREKRAIERPKNEDLLTILRVHAPPAYMYHERKPPATYGAEYSLEYEVAEAIQRKRKRGAVGLDQDEAIYDMERMGLRDPYRGAYPHIAYDPAYGQVPAHVGLPFSYEYAAPPFAGAPQHPLAAQGRTVASVAHGNSGRGDLFSAYRPPNNTSVHPSAANSQYQMMPANGPRPAGGHRPTLDDHLAAAPAPNQSRTAGGASKSGNQMQSGGYAAKQESRTAQMYYPVGHAGV